MMTTNDEMSGNDADAPMMATMKVRMAMVLMLAIAMIRMTNEGMTLFLD